MYMYVCIELVLVLKLYVQQNIYGVAFQARSPTKRNKMEGHVRVRFRPTSRSVPSRRWGRARPEKTRELEHSPCAVSPDFLPSP